MSSCTSIVDMFIVLNVSIIQVQRFELALKFDNISRYCFFLVVLEVEVSV